MSVDARPSRDTEQAAEQANAAVVYRYGLRAPLDWGLRRMCALWNRLVEIERANRAGYRAIVADEPEVVRLSGDIKALTDRRAALLAERKAARQAARKKTPTPELDAAIAALGTEIKPLLPALKAARGDARDAHKAVIAALEAERFEAVKQARQTSGCYWGNYNAVINSYQSARRRAMRDGTELKFHGGAGDARLTTQIIGGMSIAELFSGAKSQVAVAPSDHRNPNYMTLTMTVHRHDGPNRTCTWPLHLHRPLPEGARIQEVTVTRRRVAAHRKWHICFLCRVPAPAKANATLALDIGWRLMADGGLRVGTSLRSGETHPRYVMLPHDWIERMKDVEAMRGDRDEALAAALRLIRTTT